jgi:hypothetical protein
MTPAEIKFELDMRLQKLAGDSGIVLEIVGLHSVSIEDDTLHCGFDFWSPVDGVQVLFFEFPKPALLSQEDLYGFSRWLAESGYHGRTLH